MENHIQAIFSSLSALILLAVWIQLFLYSYKNQVSLPWGFGIVPLGIFCAGVSYQFFNDHLVIFSISLPLVIALIGVIWNINNIRKQFHLESLKELPRLVGVGLMIGGLLGSTFIALKGSNRIQIDTGFTHTALIAIAVQAAIAEELLFRGYFLNFLRQYKHSYPFAVLIQAIVFTFLHVPLYFDDWSSLAIIFLVGAIAGELTWKHSSIIAALILHIAFNLTTVLGWLAT